MKGFGLLEDDPRLPALPRVEELVGLSTVREEVSLVEFVHVVRDQLSSQACVGFAFSSAIEIRARISGIQLPEISPLAIYTMAREARGLAIVDTGSRPRDAADMIEQRGIVPEAQWPFRLDAVNELLPWDVFQHASAAKVLGLYRCLGLDAVELALSRGYPVVYDQTIDQAYEDYRDGVYVESGAILGRHLQTIVGYDRTKSIVRVLNSWGSDWGEHGFAWVPYDIVDRAVSVYAIPIVPKEVD